MIYKKSQIFSTDTKKDQLKKMKEKIKIKSKPSSWGLKFFEQRSCYLCFLSSYYPFFLYFFPFLAIFLFSFILSFFLSFFLKPIFNIIVSLALNLRVSLATCGWKWDYFLSLLTFYYNSYSYCQSFCLSSYLLRTNQNT